MSACDACLSICYNEWIRLNESDWLMKTKNSVECFRFFKTTLYINMKNYENISCTFSVNVNIVLNLNSYEKKTRVLYWSS